VADDGTRRLVLLRHAKSDWPDEVPDHDRPLAKRGRHDAPVVGRWLRDRGYLPDVVVCSTARRTRQTWELAAAKLGTSPAVTFEPRAYVASAQTLLYLARELPPDCRTALIIAHNPGISELAASLAGPPQEAGPQTESAGLAGTHHGRMSLPTAGVAVLEFGGDWPDLAPGKARLADFAVPREM
jgi:phosphohistidine phosphatase